MLYIKTSSQPESLSDLMRKVFSHSPRYSDSTYAVETYSDKSCASVQSRAGKIRSFDDMMELARTYFPKTTEKELMEVLMSLSPPSAESGRTKPFIANCTDIGKPTLCYTEDGLVYNKDQDDRMHNSKYKWSELLALIGKDYNNCLRNE